MRASRSTLVTAVGIFVSITPAGESATAFLTTRVKSASRAIRHFNVHLTSFFEHAHIQRWIPVNTNRPITKFISGILHIYYYHDVDAHTGLYSTGRLTDEGLSWVKKHTDGIYYAYGLSYDSVCVSRTLEYLGMPRWEDLPLK